MICREVFHFILQLLYARYIENRVKNGRKKKNEILALLSFKRGKSTALYLYTIYSSREVVRGGSVYNWVKWIVDFTIHLKVWNSLLAAIHFHSLDSNLNMIRPKICISMQIVCRSIFHDVQYPVSDIQSLVLNTKHFTHHIHVFH